MIYQPVGFTPPYYYQPLWDIQIICFRIKYDVKQLGNPNAEAYSDLIAKTLDHCYTKTDPNSYNYIWTFE